MWKENEKKQREKGRMKEKKGKREQTQTETQTCCAEEVQNVTRKGRGALQVVRLKYAKQYAKSSEKKKVFPFPLFSSSSFCLSHSPFPLPFSSHTCHSSSPLWPLLCSYHSYKKKFTNLNHDKSCLLNRVRFGQRDHPSVTI